MKHVLMDGKCTLFVISKWNGNGYSAICLVIDYWWRTKNGGGTVDWMDI